MSKRVVFNERKLGCIGSALMAAMQLQVVWQLQKVCASDKNSDPNWHSAVNVIEPKIRRSQVPHVTTYIGAT